MMTQAIPKTEKTAARTAICDLVRAATAPQANAGEKSRAFGEIVARFQDLAFGMAFTILGDAALAEDAAQEAFLAAWRQLENLREPDAFPGWFQCIVRTQCNRLTRGKRLPTSPLHLVGEKPAGRVSDPLVQVQQTERRTTVHAALAALPDHERTATVLYYLGDEEQSRIAAFLGVPVTTIKKRVFAARKRLRERISPYMEPEEIVQEAVDTTRPSRSTQFSRRILLWAAVEDGDGAQTAELLAEDPTLARTTDADGETPLHVAACCGYGAVVAALLTAGADVNARNHQGQTALHSLADGAADIEIAAQLLAAGVAISAVDQNGETALGLAARCAIPAAEDDANHFTFAEFLLSRGAPLNLFVAAALDRAPEVRGLVEKDRAGLDRPNVEGDLPLHVAARAGFRRVTGALLDVGADVNAVNAAGHTALAIAAQPGRERFLPPHAPVLSRLRELRPTVDLFAAALLGDTERLTALLNADPSIIDMLDGAGATPLMLAAWQGQVDAVRLLLARGAGPTLRDAAGRSPASVRWRAENVNSAVIDLLLAAGAPLELRTALALSDADAVESLLQNDPALADNETVTWAIENGVAPALIERLAAFGARLSPHDAAALGMTELLARLLTADTEMPRRRDEARCTPLHRAAQCGQEGTVRFLLERGAAVNATAADGSTPLHLACAGKHTAVVERLLAAGADVNAADHRCETPLFAACANGDVLLATVLLKAGARADRPGAGKTTPLHLAVQTGEAELVDLLLAHRAPLEARNYYGATPLHIAVREGHTGLVTRLLEAGADRVARDQWHRTPLHVAAWFDQAEAAALLLQAGVAVTELSYGFSTALHTAAERGSIGVAERLIAHGADVNAKSDFGRTPLHDAVHSNQPEMVAFLLKHGADPSAANDRKLTPLHWAAAAGKIEIARLLRDGGADTTIRSYKDETPADLARRYGHEDIALLIGG